MTFRHWLTIITLALLAGVVVFAWPELVKAWGLIARVNLWILALVIPVQLLSYYAAGGMIFSYLRGKGNLEDATRWQLARMALELNFVNHVLPSGGAAGFSYLGWVLHYKGVSAGRATMAQIIRFALTFVTFVMLLIVAMVILTLDGQSNRVVVALCVFICFVALGGTVFMIYIISSKARLLRFSAWATRITNRFVSFITRGRKSKVVKLEILENFFIDLHQDYLEIRRDMKILRVPFLWAIVTNICDVGLLWIAFWSLGTPIDPAALFVAFGLSSIGAAISATPGGAGAYEAIMIAFLATVGILPDVAIAGTLLARVTLVLGTIVFGYIFYQLTLNKYGKRPSLRQ